MFVGLQAACLQAAYLQVCRFTSLVVVRLADPATFGPPSAQLLPTFLPTHPRDLPHGHLYPHHCLHIISGCISCGYRSCLRGIEPWHGGQISRHRSAVVENISAWPLKVSLSCLWGRPDKLREFCISRAAALWQSRWLFQQHRSIVDLCVLIWKGLAECSKNAYVCRQSTSISVLILTFILGIPEIGLLQGDMIFMILLSHKFTVIRITSNVYSLRNLHQRFLQIIRFLRLLLLSYVSLKK